MMAGGSRMGFLRLRMTNQQTSQQVKYDRSGATTVGPTIVLEHPP